MLVAFVHVCLLKVYYCLDHESDDDDVGDDDDVDEELKTS